MALARSQSQPHVGMRATGSTNSPFAKAGSQNILNSLPPLPGVRVNPFLYKNSFHSRSGFQTIQGQRILLDKLNGDNPKPQPAKFVAAPRPENTWRSGVSCPDSTSRAAFKHTDLTSATLASLPAWAAYDRHVLRFFGEIEEEVCESNLESRRKRFLTLLYYLEDDTIAISEGKMKNSGINADKNLSTAFLSRSRIAKNASMPVKSAAATVAGYGGLRRSLSFGASQVLSANHHGNDALTRTRLVGTQGLHNTQNSNLSDPNVTPNQVDYITADDFRVGDHLQIYTHRVLLTGCDAFTKEFYNYKGEPQAQDFKTADDNFAALRNDPSAKPVIRQPRTYEKVYNEAKLGGSMCANANLQAFLEDDRKVARFYAVVEDLMTAQFERRPFTITFFIADGTVQISEQYPLNCGREPFPAFFKKAKLPRADKHGRVAVRGPMHKAYTEEDFVKLSDLVVGETIALLNVEFFIYDADPWTRKYVKETINVELEPKINVELQPVPARKPKTPPYTGFGSWDDSMSSVIHLRPKKPKKDMDKLFHMEGQVLRASAKFLNACPEDAGRRFTFNYALYDDTLMIHEPPIRNSGIVTGRFLEKAVHLNQRTGTLFQPNDLRPGTVVTVFNRDFVILANDSFTTKYLGRMDGLPNCEDEQPADLKDVYAKFTQALRVQLPQVSEIFRRFDKDNDGAICFDEFKLGLEKFGFHLTQAEILCLMKQFDPKGEGQIDYEQFCTAAFDVDFSDKPRKVVNPAIPPEAELDDYKMKTLEMTADRAETTKIRRAVRDIGDIVTSRPNMERRLSAEMNRLAQSAGRGGRQIQACHFREAMMLVGYVFEPADVERAVRCVMGPAYDEADGWMDYVKFLERLRCCFFDFCARR